MKFKLGFLKNRKGENPLKEIQKTLVKPSKPKKPSWIQRMARIFVRFFTFGSKSRKVQPCNNDEMQQLGLGLGDTGVAVDQVIGSSEIAVDSGSEWELRHEHKDALGRCYNLIKVIGKGTFGKVFKAVHKFTGECIAIKIVNKEQVGDDLETAYVEIEALKTFYHPNISQLYQVIETERSIYIIMEFCECGDLLDLINNNDLPKEPEVKRIFRQLISAVKYVHSKDIAHRDLKPDNVLLDSDGNIKLIDFNLCARMTRRKLKRYDRSKHIFLETHCGTIEYVAPEMLHGEPYDGILSDSWSLGVMLYTLLCGKFPFDEPGIHDKIKHGVYEEPKTLPKGGKLLIRRLLQLTPSMRPTSSEILNDPWLRPSCRSCPHFSKTPHKIAVPETHTDSNEERKPLDEEIIMLMSSRMSIPFDDLKATISKKDFKTNEFATYLILTKKKESLGPSQFFIWKCEWEQSSQDEAGVVEQKNNSDYDDIPVREFNKDTGEPVGQCEIKLYSVE